MGGSSSSLFSSCLSFSSHRYRCREDEEEDYERRSRRKVRPSNEDGSRWVGEPDVDRKASDFIAKFHESRCMDPEHITV
ncbi:hypothetical protein AXF42_Ash009366 [Apostasia shenzhenica]|uniref:Uncharacterized protein n=1 Tax=Apostasia shenzhenica TaxID=1088818 RepID=A0A2I0B3W3_9ASPA|nr:hypothetical protein AXF42_Ash009366 [Apostasia shenzhenica]